MKPEDASALHQYEFMRKHASKCTIKAVKDLYDEYNLGFYGAEFDFICVECLKQPEDYVLFINTNDRDYSRVLMLGGVYKIMDYNIDKIYTVDMNDSESDNHFNCLNNHYLYDYTDYYHIIYNKSNYNDKNEWRESIMKEYDNEIWRKFP